MFPFTTKVLLIYLSGCWGSAGPRCRLGRWCVWSWSPRRSRPEHTTELLETGLMIGLVLQQHLHGSLLSRSLRPHHSLVCDLFGVSVEKGDFDHLTICWHLFPGSIWEDDEAFSVSQNLLCLKGSEPVPSLTTKNVSNLYFAKTQFDSSDNRVIHHWCSEFPVLVKVSHLSISVW